MPRKLYVPLSDPIRSALVLLAQAEQRRPQEQAAILITEALSRSGFLEVVRPDEPSAKDAARR